MLTEAQRMPSSFNAAALIGKPTLATLLKALERLCICRCATLLKKSSSASLSVRAWRSGYWAGNASASALSRSTCSCTLCITQSAPRASSLLLYLKELLRSLNRNRAGQPSQSMVGATDTGTSEHSLWCDQEYVRCAADLADGKVASWQSAPQLPEENSVHQLGCPILTGSICNHAEDPRRACASAYPGQTAFTQKRLTHPPRLILPSTMGNVALIFRKTYHQLALRGYCYV